MLGIAVFDELAGVFVGESEVLNDDVLGFVGCVHGGVHHACMEEVVEKPTHGLNARYHGVFAGELTDPESAPVVAEEVFG